MKGGKCFLCDRLIETDNEECLCNDCLSETGGTMTATGRAIFLAAIVITVLLVVLLC